MKESKLLYGVGINDADYVVKINQTTGYTKEGKRIRKLLWICPFYLKWQAMMQRAYSESYHVKFPSYVACEVATSWHYFTGFKAWMEKQDWQDKVLDKDILFTGNKLYSPETCVFVDDKVNLFISESLAMRGDYPIGVSFHKTAGKYQSTCEDFLTGKSKYLGLHETPEKAHEVWLNFKLKQVYILAAEQTDERVTKALIERYENYQEFNKRGKPL